MENRIKQFLAAENITQATFAEMIDVTRSNVSHILSGRNKPGFDFIQNTSKAFPNLNLDWLIMGKGRMYKSSNSEVIDAPVNANAKDTSLAHETTSANVSNVNMQENSSFSGNNESNSAMQTNFSNDVASGNEYRDTLYGNDLNMPRKSNDEVDLFSFQPSSEPVNTGNTTPYENSPSQQAANDKHIVKIIALYSDGSFKELR